MDHHEPVKRRKIAEAIDIPTKDLGERPTKSSATQHTDDINLSNPDDGELTADDDLEKGISPKNSTVDESSREVGSSRHVASVRHATPQMPRGVSGARHQLSAQKTDQASAIDSAVDDPPADGASTDDSSTDDASVGGPGQRSGVQHSANLPATPKAPFSPHHADAPSSAGSGDVVFSDDEEGERELASRTFPGADNIKLLFAGKASEACDGGGIRKPHTRYELPNKVRLDLCQYMVRTNYLHGMKGFNRRTLDDFYDQYNLRDPQKQPRARTFFIDQIDRCAKTFTSQIRQDHGTHNATVITPTGPIEVTRYSRGYKHLLHATVTNWDRTMKRKFFNVAETKGAVRTSVDDLLQLQGTFAKALGLRHGADTPTSANPPTSRSQSPSNGPGGKTPAQMAEIRGFINDGTAQESYDAAEFEELRLFFGQELRRAGLKGGGSADMTRSGEPRATDRRG